MLPDRTRNLCTKGHRTTGGQHKATVGVLHFILEENGNLIKQENREKHNENQPSEHIS